MTILFIFLIVRQVQAFFLNLGLSVSLKYEIRIVNKINKAIIMAAVKKTSSTFELGYHELFSIKLLRDDPNQIRGDIDNEKYADSDQDLIQAIKYSGMQLPIIIIPPDGIGGCAGGYLVNSGARRLRAAKALKLTHVPVIIREFKSAADAIAAQHSENAARRDPLKIHTAALIQRLLGMGKKRGEIMTLLSITAPWRFEQIENLHYLHKDLKPLLQQPLQNGQTSPLPLGVAYQICRIPDDEQMKTHTKFARGGFKSHVDLKKFADERVAEVALDKKRKTEGMLDSATARQSVSADTEQAQREAKLAEKYVRSFASILTSTRKAMRKDDFGELKQPHFHLMSSPQLKGAMLDLMNSLQMIDDFISEIQVVASARNCEQKQKENSK